MWREILGGRYVEGEIWREKYGLSDIARERERNMEREM